ncbi:MAG: sugar phosphate isomerase/epimerase [Clostridiaceae bacterium]|nr:sugar phosphate isomerase/epimerase [Clostridiaceae bacterium]
MKFAVSITTPEVQFNAPMALLEGSFEEKLKKAKEYGYEGVELVTNNPSVLNSEELKAALACYGLETAAISTGCILSTRGLTLISPDKGIRSESVKLLADLIDFAAEMNTKVLTIGSFKGTAALAGSLNDAFNYLDEALFTVDSKAGTKRVKLVLEPLNIKESDFLNTAQETIDYIVSRKFTNVRLLLDTYHVFLAEKNPLETFRLTAPYLEHVHLADSQRLPVGKGSIDFYGVESVLKEIGYKGWQSAELSRGSSPDLNAKITIENIKNALTNQN